MAAEERRETGERPRFVERVVLDWYDGFLGGFAGAPATRRAWAVAALAWDAESLDWRLYAAAPIAWESFAALKRERDAVWPEDRWDATSEEEKRGFYDRGAALLTATGAPEFAVAPVWATRTAASAWRRWRTPASTRSSTAASRDGRGAARMTRATTTCSFPASAFGN